jgi:hypothetical protein
MIEGIIILIAVVDRAIEEIFTQIGLLEGREGTRAALAPTRLANDAVASSAPALRQVVRRSAPTTHPHHSRPYATVAMPGSLAHKPTRVN